MEKGKEGGGGEGGNTIRNTRSSLRNTPGAYCVPTTSFSIPGFPTIVCDI